MVVISPKPLGLVLALVATAWVDPAEAQVRGSRNRGQNHRNLYGERLSRNERGGAAGQSKGFLEFVAMMTRADVRGELGITESPTFTKLIAAPTAVTATPATGVPIPVTEPPEPTEPPTASPTPALPDAFVMGRLNKEENGLILSEGLSATIIANTNDNVLYASGEVSDTVFHPQPAAGDTFVDTREGNPGGWVYLSGSDADDGGMGAITFNAAGEVINYEMVLVDTTFNSNGGRTPWDTVSVDVTGGPYRSL